MNNKEETLAQKEKRLRRELITVQNEIERINLEKELPKVKAKYEGKFWKYANSCGIDYKPWELYSHCKKVTSLHEAIFDSFEMTPFENKFHLDKEEYFHLCQTEITKTQYKNAMKRMFKKLNKMVV